MTEGAATSTNPFAAPPVDSPNTYGQPPQGSYHGAFPPPGSPAMYPVPRQDDGLGLIVPIGVSPWAIASSYLGLFGLICGGATGPFAIITGILALRQIQKDPSIGGQVRAIIGIVLGTIASIILVVVLASVVLAGR